jgi:hypothetical protein
LFGSPLAFSESNNTITIVAETQGGSMTADYNTVNPNLLTRDGRNVLQYPGTVMSSTDPAIPASGSASTTLLSFGTSVGLVYTDFGQWNVAINGNTVYAGTYAGAQPGGAQTTTMPTTGSASYSGGATGGVVQANATTSSATFYGSAAMSANFATGAVTGSITAIKAYGVSGTSLLGTINSINFTATIAGSAFAGTTSASTTAGTAFDISGATGVIRGGFYGPNAVEAAGIFNLTGGTNSIGLTGAFGVKQPVPSDRRIKRDIAGAGILPNGLRLYSWRYAGGHRRFVGVMAQDVLADARLASAVKCDQHGLMRVDYAAIGYQPADLAAMQQEGEAAATRWCQAER